MSEVSIPSEVWLSEIPFITIITSSVETYKKECCGLLLGYRVWSCWDQVNRVIIEHVYQFQIADRASGSVTFLRGKKRNVKI